MKSSMSDWNESALKAIFRWGLNEDECTEMACRGIPWLVIWFRDPPGQLTDRQALFLTSGRTATTSQAYATGYHARQLQRAGMEATGETLCFYCREHNHMITNSPKHPIIQGILWLQKHEEAPSYRSPLISWSTNEIQRWTESCWENCLQQPQLNISSTSTESPEAQVQENVLSEYMQFHDVFSKSKATGLCPHRS